VEAVKWYHRAADQHLPEAEDALAECYLNGAGAPKDTAVGVRWIWKAAEQGFAPAQNRLGLCYLTGEGVAKNFVAAYKWFSLAAAEGGDRAADIKLNLIRTELLLTADQITEAQRLTREFKPRQVADGSPPGAEVAGAIRPGSPPVESASGNGADAGFLNITSEDDRCEVYVDGSFVGNTPARLKLPEGLHVTLVKKAGFKDYRREIKITGGAELNLRAVLEPR
jgi:TPR repeat protein